MQDRKLNKNIISFILCLVFLAVGVFSSTIFWTVSDCFFGFIHGEMSMHEVTELIDNTLDKKLTYHELLLNLNSIKENIIGTRVVEKDDATVVKSNSGSLIDPAEKLNENEISKVVSIIAELKKVSEDNGAKFLYCAIPKKELFERAPANIDNYFKEKYDMLLSHLAKENIPAMDVAQVLREKESEFDLFYYTDHHWTTRSGFAVTNALVKELQQRYGFEYNTEIADINNYDIKQYPDWFLGSKGKKVGIYFTWHGADDFDLITPKFNTNLTEEQPFKNQVRNGKFEDTVLYMENLEKDYYNVNTYATYSGGDFRLQIIKNNLNPEGKKVLIIRDSFSCVLTPFLSLQTGELHVCDVRAGDYYIGDKLNMKEYIEEIKPDYVLVAYTNVVEASDSRYNFFE